MKKINILISIILLTFTLVSCGSSNSTSVTTTISSPSVNSKITTDNNIFGVWKYELNGEYREAITSYITDEYVYIDYYYEFYEDGTGCTYSSMDTTKVGFSYVYNDGVITLTTDDGSFDTECQLSSTKLVIIEGDDRLTFEKQ